MLRMPQFLSSTCLAATLILSVANIGCTGRVRVYDEYHHDYHQWDHNEDLAYHQYWNDRQHGQYRDYNSLNKGEQQDYWNWRHDHPDHH